MKETFKLDNYQQIIQALRNGHPTPYIGDLLYYAQYTGKVYSKGRPRVTKTGHAFTPENTRKFEKSVAQFYETTKAPFLFCPLMITIVLYDKPAAKLNATQHRMMEEGYTFASVGDVDNRAKSILDAGNGVLFHDDSQVNHLNISRQYAPIEGFSIVAKRNGFSKNEMENIQSVSKGEL